MRNPAPEAVRPLLKPVYDGPRIVLGTFDAEAYWRPDHLAKLPAIQAAQGRTVAGCMDELLFPFCGEDGVLITRQPMNAVHAAYLRDIGFRFRAVSAGGGGASGTGTRGTREPGRTSESGRTCEQGGTGQHGGTSERGGTDGTGGDDVFRAIASQPDQAQWRRRLQELPWAVYAVIPSAAELARRYGVAARLPAADIAARVNSKAYSHRLAARLGWNPPGHLAEDADEAMRIGTELLRQAGKLVLKDPYGVSGSGNLAVDSAPLLERLIGYIRDRQRAGKRVQLLLEPWLKKELDFSCHLQIKPDGAVSLLGVQQMANRGHNYGGSHAAEPELAERLNASGYFAAMEQLAACLYEEGYFGPACVDSMLLADGRVHPVVEINARHSMGLLNYSLDTHWERCGQRSFLSCLQLGLPDAWKASAGTIREMERAEREADAWNEQAERFAELLARLDRTGLLFTPERREGVVPLSANTLFAPGSGRASGRWYVSLAAGSRQESERISRRLREALAAYGFRIY
ncbi:peptide ligase PGM1-related protein [Paenibacillus melissococcoides]|uniref:Peptide ligase PGM1-related protein n=1 Tax=Paenibacillus melissococcoides TaxID=2912268 RepID=A0ABN8U086_9BACL|nr:MULTISPECIES: peptide ligase PGM1-related protein [Paenibacillus]MEB9892597.1 peptide ligase PGM1-related protein [Bacillus cereus]CAH8242952.1 peptide ligase PGM1-related protein [Paenibacillus melissococcoides]CAH8703460.1 peptide ligase PGM1-related protein [Paenibacillus melissococcoides]CAH8706351.1 peptide ligase PGM1-related protein [Paenibacillus melissococcoides]GIO80109.1 phosphoribosylglycinamide formyltransferase 2 [Paenibacillus dendritiformis]